MKSSDGSELFSKAKTDDSLQNDIHVVEKATPIDSSNVGANFVGSALVK